MITINSYYSCHAACQSVAASIPGIPYESLSMLSISISAKPRILLPVQAEAMVDTFFEPVKGLNVDRVNEFLKLINL